MTCSTQNLGSPSISFNPFVSAAIVITAPASYNSPSYFGKHSAMSDLISSAVDENTERFMTIPKTSPDRKQQPSPSPQRRKHAPSRKIIPGQSLVDSQVDAPSNIHKDGIDWLQICLGLSSSEQDALIREQERMLLIHCWDEDATRSSISEQESSPDSSSSIPPLTAPQSEMDCQQAGGAIKHYPRKRVRIHQKKDSTIPAPHANGDDAAIFWCARCENCLLAAEDTKLLYCSECGTLTPTEIKDNFPST